jgi:hypothetical protein
MYASSRSLVLAAGVVASGCGPPDLPPGDPAATRPRVDTTSVTIAAVQYTVKLDGTLHFPASPINLTVTATPAGPAPPSVTRLEVIVTPEGAAKPTDRATFLARWVAGKSGWEVDIRNAFPDPNPVAGPRLGRNFPSGPYLLAVDLYDGDRPVGQVGPLEVYLNFVRTGG